MAGGESRGIGRSFIIQTKLLNTTSSSALLSILGVLRYYQENASYHAASLW